MATNTHPAYRPDIDGLRAVAVLAVVLFHGFPSLIQGGFVGVDIFFVISGYLISTILIKEHEAGQFSYAGFYSRRIRRIFPALILVLAFTFALGWFSLFADEFTQLGKHIAGGGLFAANFVFWSEAGYFDTASHTKLLLHLWSLGIEEQFYIFWPILLGLIWKPRWTAIGIAVFMLASFVANIVLTRSHPAAAFYFPFSRFWELLTGATLAWSQLKHPAVLTRYRNGQSLLGLLLISAGLFTIREAQGFPGYWALLPVLGSALLISAGPATLINRWLIGNRLMVGIGLISYPLYLWHWPIMAFIRICKDGDLSHAYATRAILASLLLAWLTYRFVEKPFRSGPVSRPKILLLALAMTAVVIVGLAVFFAHGFPERRAATAVNQVLLAQTRKHPEIHQQDCKRWPALTEAERNQVDCLTTSSHPDIAIVGDSHALFLHLSPLLGETASPAVLFSQAGCLPFADYSSHLPGVPDCLAKNRAMLSIVVGKKELKTVVLLTRGPLYLTGKGFGVEGNVGMTLYDKDGKETEPRQAFLDGYSDTIQRLQAAGKRVVFMIDWPELGVDPRNCIGHRLLQVGKTPPKSDCTNSRATMETWQADYRALVQTLQTRFPALEIYDTLPLFCDDRRCYGLRDGELYYSDDDHLSPAGSHKVLTAFRQWLEHATKSPEPKPGSQEAARASAK